MADGEGGYESLTFTEQAEQSWIGYLKQFKDEVYPTFEPYGFTLPEAFNAWMHNKLSNAVDTLIDRLTEKYGD